MAQFRIDQPTPGAGTPGRARHDLVAGETITLVATQPVSGTYTWEILDKVGTNAVLSATTGPSVTIDGAGVVAPCSFLVRMSASDGTSDTRSFSVRAPNSGLRYRLFGETSPPSQRINSNNPDLSTDNSVYASLAGTGVSGQNWRGWAEAERELVDAVEAASSGGGGGGATGFFWLPGGADDPGTRTYSDFVNLVAAVNAAPFNERVVFIDDTNTDTAIIPAGTHNLQGWTIKTRANYPPSTVATYIQMGNGVVLQTTNLRLEGVELGSVATDSAPHILADDGTVITLMGAGLYGSATNSILRVVGVESSVSIWLMGVGSYIQNNAINVPTNQEVVLLCGELSSPGDNSINGDGAVDVRYYATSVQDGGFKNPTTYSGGAGLIYATQAEFLGYNDSTFEVPNLIGALEAQRALDRQKNFQWGEFGPHTVWNGPLNGTTTPGAGLTEVWLGSIWLSQVSVIKADSRALLGEITSGGWARLRLRRFTGGTLIASWSNLNGAIADVTLDGAADIIIENDDWYDLYLVAGGNSETAAIKGLRLNVVPGALIGGGGGA